ncbi:hypothetical protein ES703_53979 [subsurface metagenome]
MALLKRGYRDDPLTWGAAGSLVKSELAQAIGRKQELGSGGGSYNNYYVYLLPGSYQGVLAGLAALPGLLSLLSDLVYLNYLVLVYLIV